MLKVTATSAGTTRTANRAFAGSTQMLDTVCLESVLQAGTCTLSALVWHILSWGKPGLHRVEHSCMRPLLPSP